MQEEPRSRPQGAIRDTEQGLLWRVWAPSVQALSLVTWPQAVRRETVMEPEGCGYFVHREREAVEGLRYAFKFPDGSQYPDPASRWQPDGVHRPSAVFFPEEFPWSDQDWRGVPREDLVIYELHVGAFTPEGTFEAVLPRLPELADLGITAVEIMPVAQFPGERNWGYDGAYPYAVQHSYGGPRGLQKLVDAAHAIGLAVLLDVVYNHLGPEGNYLSKYGPYFTDRYRTPWGPAVNYDGPESDPVRRFFVDNARMWIRDYHLDGLRLDAVHAIYDLSAWHILAEIQEAVAEEATQANRAVHVIAESNQNDVRLITSADRGGYGLDGVWSDDFHHSVHALLTGERDGYYQDFGRGAQLAKAFESVFVYDGCYSRFRRRRHGSRVGDLDRSRFVVCIQNHDQVGNRAQGDRLVALLPRGAGRLACGLLLLSPCTPLLFMGEEYGETRPFPFFCSFGDLGLIEAVRRGRREEFAALAFAWGGEIADPQSPEAVASAKLSWQWPGGSARAGLRQLYKDLLKARHDWPPLHDRAHTVARLVSAPGEGHAEAGVLVLARGFNERLVAYANLGPSSVPLAALDVGKRRPILSTEDQRYGGGRTDCRSIERLDPYEMVIFAGEGWQP